MPHIPSYFHFLGPYEHIAGGVLAFLILAVFAFRAYRALQSTPDPITPEESLSIRTLAEVTVELLRNFVRSVMGERVDEFLPFFGSFFLFIFVSNLLGIIPGFNPPTANINTNLGMALVVFFATHYYGFKHHGIGYLKHFLGPVVWLAFLLFPIEMISHLVRPLSLSLRLFGNMTGDHVVLSVFTDLTRLIVPVIFLGLGVFVSFIQAVVFTMLSMIYIQLALQHDHD